MKTLCRASAIGLLVLGSLAGLSAQASDPAIGTWVLNVSKSRFNPGPAPKSQTVVYEAAGDGVAVVTNGVDVNGNKTSTRYTASYDGKDYPLRGSAVADAVSLKRIDARTVERTDKKAGKVVGTFTRTVSADGKTLAVTSKGTNVQGRATSNVAVYERR